MSTTSPPLHFAPPVTYAPQTTFTALNAAVPQSAGAWTVVPGQIFSGPGSTSSGSAFVGGEMQSPNEWTGTPRWTNSRSGSIPSKNTVYSGAYTATDEDTQSQARRKRRHDSTQQTPPSASTITTASTTTARRTGRRRTSEDLAPGSTRAIYLEKNRRAATKCRTKQKQEQEDLVVAAREYESKYKILKAELELLKADKRGLMDLVGSHAECPDQRMQMYVQHEADRLAMMNEGSCSDGVPLQER
jgi:hypothetical protein